MKKKIGAYFVITILTIVLIIGCTNQNTSNNNKKETTQIGDIAITSSAFKNGRNIPIKYTCDGDGISPPLSFENIPNDTISLVLIVDNPDAQDGTWNHWIVFNIPADITEFKEDMGPRYYIGRNSCGDTTYDAPCPPIGEEHRYYFRLYALDSELGLLDGASREEINDAMTGHIIGQTSLMGKYSS